ncbi:cytochrome b [Candidatus Endoriftia persephone]|jgi:cytochrome b561|uniref:Cytochrome b n=1 Tax=Candidatus Endoriftia persephonae TaxID=393765 RepID=A0A9J6ZW83_9GAMM|nr:cytochrome b [Candidatus Endoriftia persephone]USF87110.1 cytochrome b [Candidatus Endoriftia persephone]
MQWRNTTDAWGLPAILLHWLVALGLFGLFGLGLWMTGLDYYHPWYRRAPDLHRSIGSLLFLLVLLRLGWRLLNPTPTALPNHLPWEHLAARLVHWLLYLLPLLVMLSGYLISTADGRAVSVFDWFELPALLTGLEQQEEVMGRLHKLLAWGLIGTAAVHTSGALKHHFFDHDTTLTHILGSTKEQP